MKMKNGMLILGLLAFSSSYARELECSFGGQSKLKAEKMERDTSIATADARYQMGTATLYFVNQVVGAYNVTVLADYSGRILFAEIQNPSTAESIKSSKNETRKSGPLMMRLVEDQSMSPVLKCEVLGMRVS